MRANAMGLEQEYAIPESLVVIGEEVLGTVVLKQSSWISDYPSDLKSLLGEVHLAGMALSDVAVRRHASIHP